MVDRQARIVERMAELLMRHENLTVAAAFAVAELEETILNYRRLMVKQ